MGRKYQKERQNMKTSYSGKRTRGGRRVGGRVVGRMVMDTEGMDTDGMSTGCYYVCW